MLCVSGADLTGKSTFCAKVLKILQEDYKLPHMLHHLSRPPASFDYCQDYVDIMSVCSVWDRFHLDSLAYRACDDHPCRMTPLTFAMTEAQFRLHCGYQVVLYEDQSVIEKRFAEKGDPLYSLEHILKVNEQFYDMCWSKSGEIRVREKTYQTSIDAHSITPDDKFVRYVVENYTSRLREFGALTHNMRLMANLRLGDPSIARVE